MWSSSGDGESSSSIEGSHDNQRRPHRHSLSSDQKQRMQRRKHHREKIIGDKIVAAPIRNSEFQQKRDGDIAVLFFKEYCPYCKNFKPIWNRVARGIQERWARDSAVYDEKTKTLAKPPDIRKMDVVKFANVQKSIKFPSVPTIALYKRGQPVVFLTTENRSLPNILRQVEDYYKRNKLPPVGEHVIGDEYGQFPAPKVPAAPTAEAAASKPEAILTPQKFKREEPEERIPPPNRSEEPSVVVATRQSAKAARGKSAYATTKSEQKPSIKSMTPHHTAVVAASVPAAQASIINNRQGGFYASDRAANDIFAKLLVKLGKNKGNL